MGFEDAIAHLPKGERKRFGPEQVDPAYVAPYGVLGYNYDWGSFGLGLEVDPQELPRPKVYGLQEVLPAVESFSATFRYDPIDLDLYIAQGPYVVVSERFKDLLLQECGPSFYVWPVEAKWRGGLKRLFLLSLKHSHVAIDAARTPFLLSNVSIPYSKNTVTHLMFDRDYVFVDAAHPPLFYEYYGRRMFISRAMTARLQEERIKGVQVVFSKRETTYIKG